MSQGNAFVTGGSRGLGRATVLRLIEDGWGCAFTFREQRQEADRTIEMARGIRPDAKVRAYALDVKDSEAVEEVVDSAIDEFGSICAVVNNAAVVRNNAAAMMTDAEWDDVLRTNLHGPFFVVRAFLMHFVSQRHGRFVNIGSLAEGGSSGQANYSAAKAGLIGLTKTIAKEYGSRGITSNAVTVGFVETDMTREHMAEQLKDFWVKHCPTGRVSLPEEIAGAIAFLVSGSAGSVNGHVLTVSGGLTYAP